MNLYIAICDDELEQLKKLSQIVSNWALKNNHQVLLSQFSSAENFLFEYNVNKIFHILLLDIEMKEISGLDLAKLIRKKNDTSEIIFITSHFEFCSEGYEVDALHYLIKPVSPERLGTVLDRAVGKLVVEPLSVIIACDGETCKIFEQDILYVEAFLHYITIHTATREYKIKESLSAFESKLSESFYRLHRSYLVCLKHITRISRTAVWLDHAEICLPLARGKYDDINRAFIENN